MFKSKLRQKGLKTVKDDLSLCNYYTIMSVVRPSGRPSVRKQYIGPLSLPKLNIIETYSCCWPKVVLCMSNFGPVRTPFGPHGGGGGDFAPKNNMCLRVLIIVLFCRIHGVDVQCASKSSEIALGLRKGHSLKFLPLSPLIATDFFFSTNRMH